MTLLPSIRFLFLLSCSSIKLNKPFRYSSLSSWFPYSWSRLLNLHRLRRLSISVDLSLVGTKCLIISLLLNRLLLLLYKLRLLLLLLEELLLLLLLRDKWLLLLIVLRHLYLAKTSRSSIHSLSIHRLLLLLLLLFLLHVLSLLRHEVSLRLLVLSWRGRCLLLELRLWLLLLLSLLHWNCLSKLRCLLSLHRLVSRLGRRLLVRLSLVHLS
jgi:hypothetical protein